MTKKGKLTLSKKLDSIMKLDSFRKDNKQQWTKMLVCLLTKCTTRKVKAMYNLHLETSDAFISIERRYLQVKFTIPIINC